MAVSNNPGSNNPGSNNPASNNPGSNNPASMTFPGDMRLDVRLCPGSESRLVRVTARWRDDSTPSADAANGTAPPEPDEDRAVCNAGARFVAAIDAGLFQGPKDGQRAELLRTSARTDDDREYVDEWEMMTPPLDVEAFGLLARMIWATGAVALAIVQNAPEARLTVRDLEPSPRTERVPPWEVVSDGAGEKDVVVTVCFAADPPPEGVRATHATMKAWADVLAAGGFAAPSFPVSAALLSELGTELENEVFASFEALSVRREGWAALWTGLQRIHTHARIERVEIR